MYIQDCLKFIFCLIFIDFGYKKSEDELKTVLNMKLDTNINISHNKL